ncbi:hypothetical protein TRFO_32364 [Tritrichomonas foetus]|uniref:DOCKER domain-containing protein n=1 Tax=Tritrichomonas foetus TaxID=1144522 RepID=A0A1J4JP84_9EUKA|nr:hypothetical protein TRFO_32364 [Tritrichomonas foetus]|eukprot:OHT00851.1 hypothetical protein TRFO_32364 [Tritrichomonas foetus]
MLKKLFTSKSPDEKAIRKWMKKRKEKFEIHSIDTPQISVKVDDKIWTSNNIPNDLNHPGANFFRTPALVLERNYRHPFSEDNSISSPNKPNCEIPKDLLQFDSTPGQQYSKQLLEIQGKGKGLKNEMELYDPLSSILNRHFFSPIADPRKSAEPIRIPDIAHVNLTFSEFFMKPSIEVISSVFCSVYIFDSVSGKRVSETWSFVPPIFHEQISKLPSFEFFIQTPLSASFAIHRPKVSNNVSDEDLMKGLYIIVVLSRPLMPKAGAAINAYWEKPKDSRKKESAITAYKAMNYDGFLTTFGYSAVQITPKLLQDENNLLEFNTVIHTTEADEAFFKHKLNKVRKHPVLLPIGLRFNIKKCQQHEITPLNQNNNQNSNNENPNQSNENIKMMNPFYSINPFFKLNYVNTMILKIVTVSLSGKLGTKGRSNLAMVLAFVDKGKTLNVFGGQMVYKTQCKYHSNSPKFHEDIFVTLPDQLTSTMSIIFQIYHLSSKKGGEPKKCGEAQMQLCIDEVPITNGNKKIPIKALLGGDSKNQDAKNSYLYVDVVINSSTNASDRSVFNLLNGDLTEYDNITFENVVSHLPPVLDVVLSKLSDGNDVNAFKALVNIIDHFPIYPSDPRYSLFKSDYEDKIIQPYDHLTFYLKYCALRNCDAESLFQNLISFWILRARELQNEVTETRNDLRSAPFLLELIGKAICIKPDLIAWGYFEELISLLQEAVFSLRTATGAIPTNNPDSHSTANISQVGCRLNHSLSLLYKDMLEVTDRGLVLNFVSKHLSKFEVRKNLYDQQLFTDFLSDFLTPKALLFTCIPLTTTNNVCFFAKSIIPIIEVGLATREHTQKVFSILYKNLLHYNKNELRIISEGLLPLAQMFGRNREIFIMNQKSGVKRKISNFCLNVEDHLISLMFPFIVTLFLLSRSEIEQVSNTEFGSCCRLLIEIANTGIEMDSGISTLIEKLKDPDGQKNYVHFIRENQSSASMSLLQQQQQQQLPSAPQNSLPSSHIDSSNTKSNDNSNNNVFPTASSLTPSTNEIPANVNSHNNNSINTNSSSISNSNNNANNLTNSSGNSNDNISCINLKEFWEKFAFIVQMITIQFTFESKSISCLSDIFVTLSNARVSNALFPLFKYSVINYCKNNTDLTFTSDLSRAYKMVAYIIKNISNYNVEIIDKLWEYEKNKFKTTNRSHAFFLKALMKYPIKEENLEMLINSHYRSIAKQYIELTQQLEHLDYSDDNNHEFIADLMLELANFFTPSPDCRVKQLLELAQFHLEHGYVSEGAVAQLSAAALVAEYLNVLKRLPNVFSDKEHPALSFTVACPSASSEVCTEIILKDRPKVPGFCTSKYFCECGLLSIIQTTMDTCKRAQLYELFTKIHELLRPLAEYRRMYEVLKRNFQNGALSYKVLDHFGAKNDRSLGNYYRVEFQTGSIYIYRETQLANLWQVNERLKGRSQNLSQGKPVIVVNDGIDLSTTKMQPENFYVHVKAVEQYFTPEERMKRVTVFEQNHNVNKFYFDLPYSKTAQMSIEYCYLKRTIFTLPHPMPYIVSRVLIPPSNIETLEFTPIEYSCQSLQKQIDNINEACSRCDFKALQPLIQGSLLAQVNEGPKKMAEVFLNGSTENEYTQRLRELFRTFLKVNQRAVKAHGEWVTRNPVYQLLQEELELGLNRLSSTLQTYLK